MYRHEVNELIENLRGCLTGKAVEDMYDITSISLSNGKELQAYYKNQWQLGMAGKTLTIEKTDLLKLNDLVLNSEERAAVSDTLKTLFADCKGDPAKNQYYELANRLAWVNELIEPIYIKTSHITIEPFSL